MTKPDLSWMTPEQAEERHRYLINSYIFSLRSHDKRNYAKEYRSCVLDGSLEPHRPNELSYMAAQAVRMRIDAIMADETE